MIRPKPIIMNDPAEANRMIRMIQPKPIITNDPAEAYRMSRMIQPKPIIIRFMARGDGKPPFTKTERFAMTPRGIAKRISSHGRQIRNENRDNRKPTHRGRHSASAFVVTVNALNAPCSSSETCSCAFSIERTIAQLPRSRDPRMSNSCYLGWHTAATHTNNHKRNVVNG